MLITEMFAETVLVCSKHAHCRNVCWNI